MLRGIVEQVHFHPARLIWLHPSGTSGGTLIGAIDGVLQGERVDTRRRCVGWMGILLLGEPRCTVANDNNWHRLGANQVIQSGWLRNGSVQP